ncbi:hypothetical protein IJJ37_02225 [Candidatus Saccharibacteria bacterium]|nr:hypothetical protein [Candidatus Saccharibacteria bacterium]
MNTNSITGGTYRIHGGPSRDLLIDAFKYAYDDNVEVVLDFGIAAGYTGNPNDDTTAFVKLPAKGFRLTHLSHEDGSGKSFNFSGYCLAAEHQGAPFNPFKPFSFTAYFNTKSREGWITFDDGTSAYPKP